MKKYKFFWMISLSSLFFILLCSGAWANSWDDLVRFYDLDKRMTYEAHILRQKLLQEACNISSEELWRSLRQNLTPRQKAANSLLLIERLCSGNLQNWEEVEGFWYPGLPGVLGPDHPPRPPAGPQRYQPGQAVSLH